MISNFVSSSGTGPDPSLIGLRHEPRSPATCAHAGSGAVRASRVGRSTRACAVLTDLPALTVGTGAFERDLLRDSEEQPFAARNQVTIKREHPELRTERSALQNDGFGNLASDRRDDQRGFEEPRGKRPIDIIRDDLAPQRGGLVSRVD